MSEFDRLREVLRDTLQIGARADQLKADSRLLGAIPEFDSVAIVGVVAAIEEEFGVRIADRELSADLFETFGSLNQFVSGKTRPLSGELASTR